MPKNDWFGLSNIGKVVVPLLSIKLGTIFLSGTVMPAGQPCSIKGCTFVCPDGWSMCRHHDRLRRTGKLNTP